MNPDALPDLLIANPFSFTDIAKVKKQTKCWFRKVYRIMGSGTTTCMTVS